MTKPRQVKHPLMEESFGSILKEEGIFERVKAASIKRVLAIKLKDSMKQQNVTKNQMARTLKISRAQLDRLLDPENDNVTLATLRRAAAIIDQDARLEFEFV